MTWRWRPRPGEPGASWAAGLSDGTILMADSDGGVRTMARDGTLLFRASSPVPGRRVSRAALLADGSFLISVPGADPALYRVSRNGAAAPVPAPLESGRRPSPRGLAPGDAPGEVLLWDDEWNGLHRATVVGSEVRNGREFSRLELEPARNLLDVVSDGRGGVLWIAEGWWIGRATAGGTVVHIVLPYAPASAGPAPGSGFLVSYVWLPDATWPDVRPAPGGPTVSWPRLVGWLLGGSGAAAALAVRRRRGAERALAAGIGVVMAGGVVLVLLRLRPGAYTDAVGLFLALLLVLLGLSVAPRGAPEGPGNRDVLLPLVLGAVTIGYRFAELPANVHFDYFFNAWSALDLLEGRVPDVWKNGFVPAPYAGLVPLVLGWLLAGKGVFGLKLGGALVALAGIFFTWLLAREVAGRRAALFAGLLVAGAVPWIHFGRLNCNVEAATATVAALALFARALDAPDKGRWILAGLAAGYSFYLWPGARAGLATCVIWLVLSAFRRPRESLKRAAGPALMLLAVAVWIAPLVPLWLQKSTLMLPRVADSVWVYKPGEGLHVDRLAASFGMPLLRAAGWFFATEDGDGASHGTLSPGCNRLEQGLLVAGVVLALARRGRLLLPLLNVGVVLVVGGAFTNTVWYNRLMPGYPAAAVLMAAGADVLLARLPAGETAPRRRGLRAAASAAAAAILTVSAVWNLARYARYEDRLEANGSLEEMVAVGRSLREVPREWPVFLVRPGQPDWSVDPREQSHSCGELLPFVWDRRVSEVRDLRAALAALPIPAALVVPGQRPEDLARIRNRFPAARVVRTRGYRPGEEPWIVLVEPPG